MFGLLEHLGENIHQQNKCFSGIIFSFWRISMNYAGSMTVSLIVSAPRQDISENAAQHR